MVADNTQVPLLEADSNGSNADDGQRNRRKYMYLLPILFVYSLQAMMFKTMVPEVTGKWFKKDCVVVFNHTEKCKTNYAAAQSLNGMVDSITNLFCIVSVALLGRLSDVYGRKRGLMFGIGVSAIPVMTLFLTRMDVPVAYYGAVIVAGILGVGTSPIFFFSQANAFIADLYSEKERPMLFGIFMATSTSSMVFTPLITHLTRNMKLDIVALFCVFMVLGCVLYIKFFLPESLPKERRNTFSVGRTLHLGASLRLLSQSRIFRWVAWVHFLGICAENGVKEIVLIYVDDVLNLEGDESRQFNGYVYAVIGLMMCISNSVVLKFLLNRNWRPTSLFLLGQVNNSIHMGFYFILGLYPHKWFLFLNSIPTSMITLSAVAASTLVSVNMGTMEQGFALGTIGAITGLADVIGPFLFSEFYYFFDKKYDLPMFPFGIGILLSILSIAFTIFGPLRAMEKRPKRMIAPSHSRMYEAEQDELESDDDGTSYLT